MSNLAKIVKASKDPRCIMSVIPNNGGTWASSISSITPQPVTTQRNFATNPKEWTNYDAWFSRQNKTDDFEFTCEFESITPNTVKNIFYTGNAFSSAFGLYQQADNLLILYTCLARTVGTTGASYPMTLKNPATFATGRQRVKTTLIGTILTGFLNGVQVATAVIERRESPVLNQVTKSLDGYIYDVRVKNLTTGDEWKYPNNITEKVQLLELDNTDTSGGVFKSADLTQPTWYSKTALNLAGRSTSFTALGKMYIAPDSGAGTTTDYDMNVFHPLMQQGYTQSGGVEHVFGLLYESLYGSKRYRASVALEGDKVATLIHNVPDKPTNTVVTMATTFNLDTGIIKLYLDGEMVRQGTVAALASGTLREDTSNGGNTDRVYIRQLQAGWQNRNDRIYWAMVYDGVLSDTEIKYLST